jgi:hypothetical protein
VNHRESDTQRIGISHLDVASRESDARCGPTVRKRRAPCCGKSRPGAN